MSADTATTITSSVYDSLLGFLDRLEGHNVPYTLDRIRPEAIMVQFSLPGERWEVEFLAVGEVEAECFRSDGTIQDESALDGLWQRLANDAIP